MFIAFVNLSEGLNENMNFYKKNIENSYNFGNVSE